MSSNFERLEGFIERHNQLEERLNCASNLFDYLLLMYDDQLISTADVVQILQRLARVIGEIEAQRVALQRDIEQVEFILSYSRPV